MAGKGKGTIKCKAEYPFVDSMPGDIEHLWGVPFVHEVVKQGKEELHVLVAELPEDQANELRACGRVSKLP